MPSNLTRLAPTRLPVAALLVALLLALVPAASAQEDPFPVDCSMFDAETTYSLYYEFYKNEEYELAKPYLRCMLQNFPLEPNNDGRNFDRAIRMYSRFADDADDTALAGTYRDTVLLYMDARSEALDAAGVEYNAYESVIDKANYLYNIVYDQEGNPTGVGNPDEVFELYQEADTAYPDSVPDFVINFLGRQYLERGMRDELIQWGQPAMERIDTEEGRAYFEANILENVFASNEDKFEYLLSQFREGEREPEMVAELFDLAFRLSKDEVIAELKPVVLEGDPSPRVLRILTQQAQREGDFAGAIELIDRAIAQAEDEEQRIDLMYRKAVLYQNEGQLGQARQIANEILEVNENHGPSLIIIGDYWAGLAGGGSIGAASPVWVAVDYYNRAASRDPEVASQARQKASSYSRYFPCREDAFFQGIKDGDGYTTPQGARTTVRLRNC
jgi:tetratricopeptide (TPR) repeat protein